MSQTVKEFEDEIFMLELPEGGSIDDIHAVGFTGWEGTMHRQPKQPVVFYAKVIAFEDANAPIRNWQTKDKRIAVAEQNMDALREVLKKLL